MVMVGGAGVFAFSVFVFSVIDDTNLHMSLSLVSVTDARARELSLRPDSWPGVAKIWGCASQAPLASAFTGTLERWSASRAFRGGDENFGLGSFCTPATRCRKRHRPLEGECAALNQHTARHTVHRTS